jgi:TPR repeat protein
MSPAPPQPVGISHDTLKGAWEGKACECFQVGQAWEQTGDYNNAAKWYRLSAEQGYALAQANLAMLYERNRVMMPGSASNRESGLFLPDGRMVEANDITLLDLRWHVQNELKQARAKAQAVTSKQLSDRWRHLQENLAEAIHWYHEAAQQGHAGAQYNLGRIYLQLVKERLHPQDQNRLPQDRLHQFSTVPPPAFYHQGKPDDLVTRWTREAKEKDAKAQYQLGLLHFHGVDGTPNLARSARLWQASADQKYHAAEHALARLEAKGTGVALNTESAVRRYRRLAYHFLEAAGNQGVRDAWLALGHLHLELATDPRRQRQYAAKPNGTADDAARPTPSAGNLDYRGARLFFERAAQPFKHTVSNRNATAIAEKYGLPLSWLKNANPGMELDDLASGQMLNIPGAPEAMLILGRLALEGAGQARDESTAAAWFARAIPYRQPDAYYLLGYLHHNGLGVKQDLVQARAHYEEAARMNHARAQYNLGLLYYQGVRPSAMEPITPPARHFQLSMDPAHKPTLIALLHELQFVDSKFIKAGRVQYVPHSKSQREVLQVESPNRNAKAIFDALKQAFPKANFQWIAHIEMPRDPLRHKYVSADERRAESNERAWHWWKLAELNRLEEARRGREFLEKFIRKPQLKEANLVANRQRESLIQISQPRKRRLTISPQPFAPMAWAAGFMITTDGYLITSQDMVTMGKRFRVTTESGTAFEAHVVDTARTLNGFALLKIDGGHRFRPLPLTSSRTVHEREEVYVMGFKPLKKSTASPEACSILTHVASTLGNQADSRFLTLSENVLGDRLFLRFNKYVDSRRTPASTKRFGRQASVEERSLRAITATLIAHNENLARSQAYGYRLAQELWHDPITGQWNDNKTHDSDDELHFAKGKFVVMDGKLVRTLPPTDKLEHGGRPLLRILAPTGLALPAEKALRKAFLEAGFERDSFQPGLRGMALLNRHGQAIAIHYPPLRPNTDHDYPNFNTYDRFALKADALISALRQRTELRLDESRPVQPTIAPALRLTDQQQKSQPGAGLESLRPDTWTPPSTRFSLVAHTHPDPKVSSNLNACNLALECIDSPMLSRARASLVLVQVAE